MKLHIDLTFKNCAREAVEFYTAALGGELVGFNVQTEWPTVEQAKAAFDKIGEGGEVQMPFGPTSWAAGFGIRSALRRIYELVESEPARKTSSRARNKRWGKIGFSMNMMSFWATKAAVRGV